MRPWINKLICQIPDLDFQCFKIGGRLVVDVVGEQYLVEVVEVKDAGHEIECVVASHIQMFQ